MAANEHFDHQPEAVKYAREQAGLTQTELARRCGVSLSLISQIEGNHRNATPRMLRRLAEELNCPRVVLERKRHVQTGADEPDDANGEAA